MRAWLLFTATLILLAAPAAAEPQVQDDKCEILWQDDFPLPTGERQYGPGVRQAFKVELCHLHWGKRITVWERLYREYAGPKSLEEQRIRDWFLVTSETIFPFERRPSPPPVVVPGEPGGH